MITVSRLHQLVRYIATHPQMASSFGWGEDLPHILVEANDSINAAAGIGSKGRTLWINSGCLKLPEEQILFILGHELAHLRYNDVYSTHTSWVIPAILGTLASLKIGYAPLDLSVRILAIIAIAGLTLSLSGWLYSAVWRRNEYRADRIGAQFGGH